MAVSGQASTKPDENAPVDYFRGDASVSDLFGECKGQMLIDRIFQVYQARCLQGY